MISWRSIEQDLAPDYESPPEFDEHASGMHRLRGLVMAQGAETEAVLGQILVELEPTVDLGKLTAGGLLRRVRDRLPPATDTDLDSSLDEIGAAIEARNRAVHADVTIGSMWAPYATGGGEHVPVISFMGNEPYDEADLRTDLILQQQATLVAVRLLLSLRASRRP